jgi:hypothetical protein
MTTHTTTPSRSLSFPAAALAASLLIAACGGDSTGPEGVQFPDIAASEIALYCIRGEAVPSTSVNGSITSGDCHTGITDDGYWESWHVRVASSGSVTFSASSSFDNYLELIRVDDVNDIENSSVLIAFDDDSGTDLNATITATLQVDTDYAIIVSGYDDSETGSYTLAMTQ